MFDYTLIENQEINQLPHRKAMALPQSYLETPYSNLSLEFEHLRQFRPKQLISVIEEENGPFSLKMRLAASHILALIGDPRIQTLRPQMVTIPKGVLHKGISENLISERYEDLRYLGVKEEWIQKEAPLHKINMKTFAIGMYPVTNSEYRDFLIDTQEEIIPSSWIFGHYPLHQSNHPVSSLPYEAAERYTQWLSKKTKRNFRLPTESEWEYAAKGESQKEYPWGNSLVDIHLKANICETKIFSTTSVGIFPWGKSTFGLHDMAGNVEEYTSDFYRPYPHGKYVNDDLLLALGKYRVARGGSFTRFHDLARCTRRHGAYPDPLYVLGFRPVEEL